MKINTIKKIQEMAQDAKELLGENAEYAAVEAQGLKFHTKKTDNEYYVYFVTYGRYKMHGEELTNILNNMGLYNNFTMEELNNANSWQ